MVERKGGEDGRGRRERGREGGGERIDDKVEEETKSERWKNRTTPSGHYKPKITMNFDTDARLTNHQIF